VSTSPDRPRPPLLKRLRPRHWVALDYVVGAILALINFGNLRRTAVLQSPLGAPMIQAPGVLAALILAVVAFFAVARRRRRPGLMLGVVLTGTFVAVVVAGGQPRSLVYFVPASYVLYFVVASYETREVAVRTLVAVALTVLGVGMVLGATPHAASLSALILVVMCLAIAWSTGYIVRQRRRYAVGLQEEAASKAVAEERLRIARELHDVVAHSMSVIAVQAGYGQYVMNSQPEDAREALGAIQATSREALDDMRRMLGALRQADEPAPLTPAGSGPAGSGLAAAGAAGAAGAVGAAGAASVDAASASAPPRAAGQRPSAPLSPAPGLRDLGRLVSRTASAGVVAELVVLGTPRELPPSIDLSAYRIVQESLTNVVKHARTSACRVRIGYSEDELTVEVTDNGAGAPALVTAGAVRAALPSGGHGITGMRERVSLLGGEFIAGPLPGYGFRVSARIPLPHPAGQP
jgi:signal transduction histidine kinase